MVIVLSCYGRGAWLDELVHFAVSEFTTPSYYQEIYAIVCEVPLGKVATYGQVASLSSRPKAARQVGYALAALPENHDVPWQRVVNARGEISARSKPGYDHYQRILLEEEGIQFGLHGRINLKQYLWEV